MPELPVNERPSETEQTVHLSAQSAVTPEGKFEILAITAGEGNGWQFSEEVLKASLSLWASAQVFVDHAWFSRSIRDLAGVLFNPRWDATSRGILASLKPVGPQADLVLELGHQMLAGDDAKPNVGFSADVVFTALGKNVKKILRVNSVDLVFNPARGGAFVRALNSLAAINPIYGEMSKSLKGESIVEKNQTVIPDKTEPVETSTVETEQLTQNPQVAQPKAAETAQAENILAAQCSHLLTTALNASKLPAPVVERVRAQFEGKVFDPAQLDAAIQDSREMVSALTGGAVIQGPSRIQAMFSTEDQITAALFDLLGAERPDEIKDLKAARLSGIREFYNLATGDYLFEGGYHPERAQFAVAADLPGLLKNAMNKLIVMRWEELGRAGYRWWESVVDVQHFTSLHDITGVLVGEITVLPVVNEGAAYTALAPSDSAETASFTKYGGYVGLTLEMFEKDETNKLREYPKKLTSAAIRRISSLVSAIFTANSGVGPAMADTYKVFDATHHSNLGTTALAAAAWEAACKAVYAQPNLVASGGTGGVLGLDPKYLLVPRDLRLTAQQILYPSFAHEANYFSENQQRGEMGDVIVVPDWTDANDWAAVCDPRLAPAIILGERFGLMPELFIADNPFTGALFTNDEVRMKVRHWLAVFAADYRPMYKANVA
jgi:hypothetical protein